MDRATLAKAVAAAERVVATWEMEVEPERCDGPLAVLVATGKVPAEFAAAKTRMLELIGEQKRTESRAAQRKLGELLAAAYGRRAFERQLEAVLAAAGEFRGRLRHISEHDRGGAKATVAAVTREVVATSHMLGSLRKKTTFFEAPDADLDAQSRPRAEARAAEAVATLRACQEDASLVADCFKPSPDLDRIVVDAARNGHLAGLEMALRLGASPNAAGSLGDTALTWAVQRNDTDAVAVLLDFGADVNLAGYRGCVPLLFALLYAPGCVPLLRGSKKADDRRAQTQFDASILRQVPPVGFAVPY